MKRDEKEVERVPEEFSSCEEAAEFWDSHDTVDYPEAFADVDVEVDLKGRRFDIDIDEDVMECLRRVARKTHTPPARLASSILRKELAAAGN